MIFRQLFEQESSTYTYLIACDKTRQAALIDTVKSEVPKYLQLLQELNLTLVYALDTHTHADHITGAGALREATGCTTLLGEQAHSVCVSHALGDGDVIAIGTLALKALYTPGHTDDSYTYLLDDAGESYAFTGDTLLIRGTGRTDFQNGSATDQYHSLFNKLLTLPAGTWVYPGHDYKGWMRSTIGEEQAHNPRLQVKDIHAYLELMNNLKLPNPKLMDIAVPANRACGDTDSTP
ncbi:MBL fold metallo-hydrolase [Cellvibrio japonicus]|uniref:Metallo-beta-lactamase family protein n=1 Tax=Cellvibrio japonicus (strain Ueda107) TaxID=498211 RepID=B3PD07_CELJU|nr:MBL fold metallo-hydrolase [Cellvibrio japonicus]ACE82758.1 metallo-beta-lactamase family protein [Cellvibrio japonicus Ueda107]QEI11947.1 MBL fold metallo-hydrolase [Cellvibrio japonicus]QEI15521.1 MBL fold metallo-hydrolase [Cellvibrio japonicus]QEI19100.1 MBL fold metallo-hydrolase [Cellvibrio japonicus]